MPKSSRSHRNAADISRRQLLAGASAGAAALFLERGGLHAQGPAGSTVVFSHTTVVNVDAVQNDVALAVEGDEIAAIGPTDQILQRYPRADVYDGRGKAHGLLPAAAVPPRHASHHKPGHVAAGVFAAARSIHRWRAACSAAI